MSKDFIPKADAKLIDWLKNYRQFIIDHGTELGLTSAQVTARVAAIDAYITVHDTAEESKNISQGAIQDRTTMKGVLLPDIRDEIVDIKRSTAYTPALGEIADIISEADGFDPATFKTILTWVISAGNIKIKFVKGDCDCMSIYTRLRGQVGWTFLARDTFSPYEDNRPLATPGVAETREYMARGVLNDAEFGLDSDIISVVVSA